MSGTIMNEAARWWNTARPLTRPLATTRRGLAVEATQQCVSPECDRPSQVRGLCHRHYSRWRRCPATAEALGGAPLATTVVSRTGPTPALCRVPGCAEVRSGKRSVCAAHYLVVKRRGTVDDDGIYPERLVAAFWKHVTPGADNECWEWSGTRHSDGYGLVGGCYAHRISEQIHHGPIGAGLHVLHSCDNPPCVNPAHLRTGTHSDNVRDAVERGRHWSPFGGAL